MVKRQRFPTFALAVLVLAILWALSDLGVIAINIPWFPIIIAAVALGWVLDFYGNKK